jgi:hypothetical protein
MAIYTWLTPNFVAFCHSVGNDELMNFTMCCRFMYFATVLRPEYFIMLLPVNEDLTTLNWFFNFFIFFIWKVMFFCDYSLA